MSHKPEKVSDKEKKKKRKEKSAAGRKAVNAKMTILTRRAPGASSTRPLHRRSRR